jgi:hypothetical protein
MIDDNDKTNPSLPEFDLSDYPLNTLFHERRSGFDRRFGKRRSRAADGEGTPPAPLIRERRVRKERRRRIDPTTFEKQYTDDELEFMNAMQRYKELTGKTFPSHGEVIKVAVSLGYRKLLPEDPSSSERTSLLGPGSDGATGSWSPSTNDGVADPEFPRAPGEP